MSMEKLERKRENERKISGVELGTRSISTTKILEFGQNF